MTASRKLVMTAAEIEAYFDHIFPDRLAHGWTFRIEQMEPMLARVRRLGRRLAVAHVELYSEGDGEIMAPASATYALP